MSQKQLFNFGAFIVVIIIAAGIGLAITAWLHANAFTVLIPLALIVILGGALFMRYQKTRNGTK